MRMILVFALLALVGCGSASHSGDGGSAAPENGGQGPGSQGDPGPKTPQPPPPAAVAPTSLYFADASKLPACDAATEGWLVYIAADKALKACVSGTWSAVDLPQPEPTRIVSSIHCNGPLEGAPIYFTYNASLMSTGDIYASGSIKDGFREIFTSSFYSAKQVGAGTAKVFIGNDLAGGDTGGFWSLELNRKTLVTKVTYTDFEFDPAEESWVMTPDKCIVNKY